MVVLAYKVYLGEKFLLASVNVAVAVIDCFFLYGWLDLKIKGLKMQRQVFANATKEFTKAEYEGLL